MSLFASSRIVRRRWVPSLVLLCALGCNLKGGSSPPMEPPPPPEYERAFDEFSDMPHRITAHVEWAAKPVDDAIALADEIGALRTKLAGKEEELSAVLTASFSGGSVEIGGELESSRAEIEATIAKVKQVGIDLKSIPGRVKAATKGISQMVMSTPKLMGKSSKELTGQLSASTGDGKLKIQADLDTVKKLPSEVKTQAAEAKNVVTSLPKKAQTATTNLMAAIAGKPFEPLEPTGTGAPAADPAAPDAAATASGQVGVVAAATTDPFPMDQAEPTVPPFGGDTAPKTAPMPSQPQPKDGVTLDRVAALRTIAKTVSKYGDWLSATEAYEEALALTPDDPSLSFAAGNAAMKAKDCPRARQHFDRYLRFDGTELAQRQAVEKSLGEIRTFDCPSRTPEDEAAVAQTLRLKAETFAKEHDFGGAALMYALAYQRKPEEPTLAYETGVAAWKARACGDAVSYFYHFLTVADTRAHRKQVGQSNRYIEQSEIGECRPLPSSEGEQQARSLYAQAQELAQKLDYGGAVGKYERAYALLPDNHAFELRIAETYTAAGNCGQAVEHYRGFLAKASDPRFAADVAQSKQILGNLESSGCASGGSGAGVGMAGTDSGTADGATAGADAGGPPALPAKGGKAGCSVGSEHSGGALPLGLLVLAWAGRRRRSHGLPRRR